MEFYRRVGNQGKGNFLKANVNLIIPRWLIIPIRIRFKKEKKKKTAFRRVLLTGSVSLFASDDGLFSILLIKDIIGI